MHRIESSGYGIDAQNKKYFKSTPLPPTVISAEWLQSVQEEICNVIENAGLSVHDQGGDIAHTDLWQALLTLGRPQDLIINSQATFNNAIERTGANAYRFKSGYRSIYVKYILGGYSMVSGSGPLSGGDTWGALSLNQCAHLTFEEGAYINVGDTPGYVNAATDGALLENVYVKGTGSAAAAVVQSFLTGAERVTYRNCWTSNRYTNVDFAAFSGGSYKSASYIGCKVSTILCATAAKTLRAFYQCYNMTNTYITTFTPANGVVKVIDACEEISNLYVDTVSTANALTVVYSSNNITGFDITTVTGTAGQTVHIMDTCNNVSSGIIQTISTGIITVMYSCNNISSFNITGITGAGGVAIKGFDTCTRISSGILQNFTTGAIIGIYNSSNITATTLYNFSGGADLLTGISTCTELTGCRIITFGNTGSTLSGIYGIYSCSYLSACHVESCVAVNATLCHGYYNCNFLSACYSTANSATNSSNGNGFAQCLKITACYALSNKAYGFINCKGCGFNTSTSNGTAYSTSYSDSGTSNACADTAAGGYNN